MLNDSESLAPAFPNCNLWSLPHVCLTNEEAEENKHLASILQAVNSMAPGATSSPPATYFRFGLTELHIQPSEQNNTTGREIGLKDIQLLGQRPSPSISISDF